MRRDQIPFRTFVLAAWLLVALTAAACRLPAAVGPGEPGQPAPGTPAATLSAQAWASPTAAATVLLAASPTDSPQPSATATATATPAPSETPTPAATPSPTETPTATITPTWAVLRGKVLELSNCRYGPGAPYLYKYALIPGSNLEIIGRNDLGTWILVQAIGGNNPCWVKASLMEIRGEVMSVAPTYLPLPQSPYYGPPTGVAAVRKGNEVTVSWYGIKLKAGDDSEQFPYLIEAWVCQAGQLIFTPVGSYQNAATISDEPGCAEPSHGRLYGVEKHGYTQPVEIPWPLQE